MSRFSGWFRSGAKPDDGTDSDSMSDSVAKETENLQDALKWTGLIMNDDIEGATKGLEQGDSSFHMLGLSTTSFMQSILGFEKQYMAQTTAKLAECETRAWSDYKRAQRRGAVNGGSKVYPPGTEYELMRAETQLMGAIVGVLHENLVEGMKSFYKLRKAYTTLDGLILMEDKAALAQAAASTTSVNGQIGDTEAAAKEGSDSDDFVDAKERPSEIATPTETDPSTTPTTPEPTLKDALAETSTPSSRPQPRPLAQLIIDPDNLVDAYIHSGANLFFGLLQLILSLVPPAFSRMLSIVGFRGDRHRGVSMLWKAAAYPNLNGAVGGMMLLAYYNSLLGAVDILPSEQDYDEAAETVGPPREKCERLLADMRARYPESRLWRVEESRLYANDKDLDKAIALLKSGPDSKMKQITALNNFELSLNSMMAQDWVLMRDSFLRCLELNEWSPGMYYYMAGLACVELYRDAFHSGDENEARRQKSKAEEYLRKAPTLTGKKRFLAKQLPLETFLESKLLKWETRAKKLGVDLADAIGVSPALEMGYMWNAQKRMGTKELEKGMANLEWGRCTVGEGKLEEVKEKDEVAVWAVCVASLLRGMGRAAEARAALEEHVLAFDKSTFKGPGKDDWVLPTATYEMAAIAWLECCNPPRTTAATDAGEGAGVEEEDVLEYRKLKMEACQEYLDKVRGWEAYTLDARMGLRVQSGLETLGWFRGKMGW